MLSRSLGIEYWTTCLTVFLVVNAQLFYSNLFIYIHGGSDGVIIQECGPTGGRELCLPASLRLCPNTSSPNTSR